MDIKSVLSFIQISTSRVFAKMLCGIFLVFLFSFQTVFGGYVHNFNNQNLNSPSYIHARITASWSSTNGNLYFRSDGNTPGLALLGHNHTYILTLTMQEGYQLDLTRIVLKRMSHDGGVFQIKVNDENYGDAFGSSNGGLVNIARNKSLTMRNTFTIKIEVKNGTEQFWNFSHIDDLEIVGAVSTYDPVDLVTPSENGIVYVDRNAAAGGNGSSWENALRNLNHAISATDRPLGIQQIWVANGTYRPQADGTSFRMPENVKIYGGFEGGETDIRDRNVLNNMTVLQGRGSSVIYNDGVDNTALLDGFHITDGKGFVAGSTSNGGGIYNKDSNPVISNCVFNNNQTDATKGFGRGGAISNINSNPTIIQCIFNHNRASGTTQGRGGAIYNENSSPFILNCIITQNEVGGTATSGGGIYNSSASSTTVQNSIIWNNTLNSIGHPETISGTPSVSYSIIQGGYAGGSNIIDQDPGFANPSQDNYRVSVGSPALDAGSPATDLSVFPSNTDNKAIDLAGELRVNKSGIDLGVFEFQQPTNWRVSASATSQNPDGMTWETAFVKLEDATARARDGDQIWVAKGEYQPALGESFQLLHNVNLYGGFAGNESSPDQRPFPFARGKVPAATVLKGNGSNVVQNGNSEIAFQGILDGFTITEGSSFYGGGILSTNASLSVLNCTLLNNVAANDGGGAYFEGGNGIFMNTIFKNNQSLAGDGGGLWLAGTSQSSMLSCAFIGNTAVSSGGGIRNINQDLQIYNTTMSQNTAEVGGALSNGGFGSATITSSIIYGNSGGVTYAMSDGSRYNSLIQGFGANSTNYNLDGNTDPQFTDPAAGDFSLRACSPAINRGAHSDPQTDEDYYDVEGKERFANGQLDMGAYEFQGIPLPGNLPASNGSVKLPVFTGPTPMSKDCGITAILEPAGETPLVGYVTAKTYLATGQTLTQGQKLFVTRHMDITPDGGENATARVTLFFTKQEFDNYNTAYGNANNASLPENLKVVQYHGTSASGLPGTYSGAMEIINNVTVTLSDDGNTYIVTFSVSSFSGFFVTGQSEASLPVTLTSFEAQKSENASHLSWQTSFETNSSRFEIEHSTSGKSWKNVGQVIAKQESAVVSDYTFQHKNPESGANYYRLKMIDQDGTFAYSRIRELYFGDGFATSVYPNPASDILKVKGVAAGEIAGITMHNYEGKLVLSSAGMAADGLDIAKIPSGNYLITIQLKSGETRTNKLLIAR